MKVKAYLKNLRIAPRKVRLTVDCIRGERVAEALRELQFLPKRSAEPVRKLLQSAVANAEHNFHLKKDDLVISEARVDQGPVMKRMMPRAMGRGAMINKRTSHITIVVEDKKKEEGKKKRIKAKE